VGPERVLFYSFWFTGAGHNNARYAELLPRLARVDAVLLPVPSRQPLRAVGYRAALAARRRAEPALLRRAGAVYRGLLAGDVEQVAHFPGRVVVDLDDPYYTERELALLARENVAGYVVTAERARRRFEELGIDKPATVIPQGAGLSSVSTAQLAAVAERRRSLPLVVGYVAAWLLTSGDRGGESPLYNVEHLLELWDEIHGRVPEARLWLIGGASRTLRERLRGRPDVELLGRLPRDEALAHVASLDVALYPRTADQGIQSVKVAEYLGFGIPTVAYDYAVTQDLDGVGVLVRTPGEFVAAVERLARDDAERALIAARTREAGRARDWDVLAARYAEFLDRSL
jgi:glycosyltransferase involved in cell wall biosynthesis